MKNATFKMASQHKEVTENDAPAIISKRKCRFKKI